MVDSFNDFAVAVNKQYLLLAKGELYTTSHRSLDIKDVYLNAFPEGTNPIYKTNSEHDCNCCKQFLRNLGRVVSIKNGKVVTIWEQLGDVPYPYDVVAKQLDAFVKESDITGIYRTTEKKYGTERNFDGNRVAHYHFFGTVGGVHYTTKAGTEIGEANSKFSVFKRGIEELTVESINSVLELIEQNNLYRGSEFKSILTEFLKLKNQYEKAKNKQVFLWSNVANFASGIRNTVIGTLLQDLSEGVDLEKAVKSYESKVAPTNYKRPTALVTPKMIEKAIESLDSLGLRDSLTRRHAKLTDVSVNDVLWVNNDVKSLMRDNLVDALLSTVKSSKPKNATEISIEDFLKSCSGYSNIEAYVTNNLTSNFVSITAPVYSDVKNLFKWDNNFAWSYNGNVTDSLIKERVKTAGGRVEGCKLRISLGWHNADDLDLHIMPPNKKKVWFGAKQGILDVDMNAFGEHDDHHPVENASWVTPANGEYKIIVNQYNIRRTDNVGCVIEIEAGSDLLQFSYRKPLKRGDTVFGTITYKNGVVTDVQYDTKNWEASSASKEIWGINTEQFVKVNTILLSPNHWNGKQIGNKHYMFMLDKCGSDLPVRGIYNEFLTGELEQHRKVFELLGDKTKCPVVDSTDQLSGLGFSSTQPNNLLVRATEPSGNVRTFTVKF